MKKKKKRWWCQSEEVGYCLGNFHCYVRIGFQVKVVQLKNHSYFFFKFRNYVY